MNKRVFLAVNLSEKTKKDIAAKLQALIPGNGLKQVKEENLHITILFLGYLPENAVRELAESLRPVSEMASFTIGLSGVGHFRNHVIWLGVTGGREKLSEVNSKVSGILGVEDKNFHPHVTLARNKSLKREEFEDLVSRLQKTEFSESVKVHSLDVMESVLLSNGPVYSIIKKINLKLQ